MSKQERVLLPNHVVPERYELELNPNLATYEFGGCCKILFACNESKHSITLHARELSFVQAKYVANDNPPVETSEIHVNLKATTVTFVFPEAFPVGPVTLEIQYNGCLNDKMVGFYRSSYQDIEGNQKIMASTQFEPIDARRCFPCIDEPGVKAVFGIRVTLNADLDVLSNMPVSRSERISKTTKRVSFLDTPIMSTYLVAVCVGEFDCIQATTNTGTLVSVYAPPGKAHLGRFSLEAGVKFLESYNDFFQTQYALPKLDMIAIPEFAKGAMENWGLVTYREVELLIDETLASEAQKQRVSVVVAHELAHQWFGNLCTMEWWDDLWLNEGFASWAENYSTNLLFPNFKMWEQFTTGHLARAMSLDALKSSHPIQVPIKNAEEVEEVFDIISYCKGASVVRMLQSVLGMSNFRAGLVNYMKKYAYKNTETIDLWKEWEEVSNMPIAEMMASWTEQMGFPLVKVVGESWESDKVTLELEQTWFLADGSELDDTGAAKKWTIPILSCTDEGTQSEMTLMREKTATVVIPTTGWVKLNAGQQVPTRVLCSPGMLDRLASAIRDKALPAIDRAALLNDGYALVKSGDMPPGALVKLLGNYKNENAHVVWEVIGPCLNGLRLAIGDNDTILTPFMSFAKQMVVNLMNAVGWQSSAEDDHTQTLLRSIVVGLVSIFAYDEETVLTEARSRFAAFLKDPNDTSSLPGDIRMQVFKIVLLNGGKKEFDEVKSYFYRAESIAEKKHVLNSLGSTRDPALKLATMEWSTSGEIKLQDFFYAMGGVGRSLHGGREIAWNYYKENFEKITSMLGNATPSLMDACIVTCGGQFCSFEKADEIEDFFKAHPLPLSARKIQQTLELTRSLAKTNALIGASELATNEFWNTQQ